MLPLLGLLLVVVAASTYKPRTGGSTPGGAPGPAPAPGAGGIPGRTPAGGIPGGAGARPATGTPAAGGPITAPGGTLPSGRTYDSSVCFTGIPNVVTDTDISGLPTEIRPLYQAALDMKPDSGIYNMTRDFIVGYITNLATCIEARGYTVGAQRLYQRAAEVASGVHDGPGGVPYSTPVLPPPVSGSGSAPAGSTTFTDVNGNAWTAQPSATGGFLITTSAYGGKTLEVTSLAEAQSVANSVATGPASISPGGGMIQQPLGQPPLTYTPGGSGMIQQPLAPSGGAATIRPGGIFRPVGPFTQPIIVGNPIDRAVMAIPDVPEGSGLRSEIARILRIYDSWKAPLTSFPFGDPEWLRARANAIESAYGARQAAKRLRDIAAAVEADAARAAIEDAAGRQEARVSTEWPGISAITDPTLRNTALTFARAFHKTTEVVEGQCEGGLMASGCEMDYPVTVLVPVSGVPAPALTAIEALLTAMDTLYPTAYPDAKRELRSMIAAIRAGRVRGTFTD